jgi:hypothetical protein
MRVLAINSIPSLDLAKAINSFEQEFSYPLGGKTRFRISHGDNYSGFYQSLGESQSLIAERNGIVYGAISTALRTIRTPEGESINAAYVGDFKVSEPARGTSTAHRLLKETQEWIVPRTSYAFCVVMNGTTSSPINYTGRLGIAKFKFLGEVSILRITIKHELPKEQSLLIAHEDDALLLYANLVKGHCSVPAGTPTMRSTMKAQWLVDNSHSACGFIEDTRKAKRLFALDNQEILTAHISNFVYSTPASGAEIILMSLKYVQKSDYTSIFVAVYPEHVSAFRELLLPCEILEAKASLFGNLPSDALKTTKWSVNTSEV